MASYLIHYNCGRPFEVVVFKEKDGFCVEVHKVEFHGPLEVKTRVKRIFAGVVPRVFVARESDVPEGIKLDGEDFSHEDGHVVVLELTPEKSMYIGERIYIFKTLAKLKRLESYIGTNDIPYPCVIDEEHNAYLLLHGQIILRASLGKCDDYYEVYDEGVDADKLSDMKIKVIEECS